MKKLATRSLGSVLDPNLCTPFADLGPDFITPNAKRGTKILHVTEGWTMNMQIKISEQSIPKLKQKSSHCPFELIK